MSDLIDAWVEEQLALSPAWSAEKRETIFALLDIQCADQEDSAARSLDAISRCASRTELIRRL